MLNREKLQVFKFLDDTSSKDGDMELGFQKAFQRTGDLHELQEEKGKVKCN